MTVNCHTAGLLSLQSLQLEGNHIKHELDVRLLAALPHLQHLWLAGNPVTAGMNPREQRAFIVDLMPGIETLPNLVTGLYVSL